MSPAELKLAAKAARQRADEASERVRHMRYMLGEAMRIETEAQKAAREAEAAARE